MTTKKEDPNPSTKITSAQLEEQVTLTLQPPIAIITFNRPKQLNALISAHYSRLMNLLDHIATLDNITITVLTGTGRFFSAGADVRLVKPGGDPNASPHVARQQILSGFVTGNLMLTRTIYRHPKILVAALNGPAVGLSAALLGFVDFCYATPHTYLLTPFSSLGLAAEGGASFGLVQRLGLPLANEALLMSRKIPVERLVHCGFVNKVFSGENEHDSAGFLAKVLDEVKDKLGDHLVPESLFKIKRLIRAPFDEVVDVQGVREVFAGMDGFMKGIPQKEFIRIASGQKRHKL